jgi:hypothetical protein
MIKLKDLLFENEAPNIFVPRRVDDRQVRLNQLTQKEVNKVIDEYNKGDNDSLFLSGENEDGEGNYSNLNLSGDFEIPSTLKQVRLSFYLDDSNVTKLPDNLTIKETLNISNCRKLKALPRGLKAKYIDGMESGLVDIPDDLQCENLVLSLTKIKQLPLFKNYIEDIDLDNCKYFKTLPVGFTAGNLEIKESNSFVSIPNNTTLKRLEIAECKKFTSIGNNCSIDELVISYQCDNFTTLPTDIKANLLHSVYDSAFKTQLVNKYKTKPKVMAALKSMYPNVKQFKFFWK